MSDLFALLYTIINKLDYTMADTLPLDKRKELYLKGEVEFVLAGTETGK